MSFSGLWKRTKRRFGAVNSHRPRLFFNLRCAWSLCALPALQGDAGADCPPGREGLSRLERVRSNYSAFYAWLGHTAPDGPGRAA